MRVLLAAMLGFWLPLQAIAATAPVKLSVGAPVPQFSRPDLAGNRIDLAVYRGKVVLIDFWASWCAPCIVEVPHLIGLQKHFASRGLQIVGISLDDSAAAAKTVTRRFTFNYPVLLGDAKLGNRFGGVLGLPLQILVGRDGRILNIWSGEIAPARLEQAVKAATKQR